MLNSGSVNSTSTLSPAINTVSPGFQPCAWFRRPHTPHHQPHTVSSNPNQRYNRNFSHISRNCNDMISCVKGLDIDSKHYTTSYHGPSHPTQHTGMMGTAISNTPATYFTGSSTNNAHIMDTLSTHNQIGNSQLLNSFNVDTLANDSLSIDCTIDGPLSTLMHNGDNGSGVYPGYENTRDNSTHTPLQTPTLVHYYSPNSYVLCVQSNHSRSLNMLSSNDDPQTEQFTAISSDKVYTSYCLLCSRHLRMHTCVLHLFTIVYVYIGRCFLSTFYVI